MGRDHDGGKRSDERSDDALLVAWRGGELRAGEELWRRHVRSVQRFFRNKVPWSAAIDLSQRTAEACVKARQDIQCFRKYALGSAVLLLKDYLRAEARRQRRQPDLETLTIEQTVGTPEEWVGAKQEKRVLLRALRRLPLPHQLLIELRFWEQLSDRDVAEVLGWPAGTVKTRIKAGMDKLRVEMAKLAESPEQLRSTMDSLEQWASRTHRRVADESRPPRPGHAELAQGSGAIAIPRAAVRAERPAEGLLDGVPVEIDQEGTFPSLVLAKPPSFPSPRGASRGALDEAVPAVIPRR